MDADNGCIGAALLVAGGMLLASFVFSGDPYTNGDGSRWSPRQFHGLASSRRVADRDGPTSQESWSGRPHVGLLN